MPKPPYAELLPRHFDINDSESGVLLCRVFDAFACHSYHKLPRSEIRVGSIPTLLQFYLGFLYGDDHYREGYDVDRIVCIAQKLVDIAHSSGKRKYKLLAPLDCIGSQQTLREIKKHTSELLLYLQARHAQQNPKEKTAQQLASQYART